MSLPGKQPLKPAVASEGDAETVDPLAEAEVYLAYGRSEQAVEILNEALRANPSRQDIRKRLAEIAAGTGAREDGVPSTQKMSWSRGWQVVFFLAIFLLLVFAIRPSFLSL